jgi:D-sedoheptulose 7-phosphate isomerase
MSQSQILSGYQAAIQSSLSEGIALRQQVLDELTAEIQQCGQVLIEALGKGGKLIWCGNGGSAADAQHLSAELIGRFESDNHLPSIALTTDTSVLTAVGNDYGFDRVFSMQIQALARPEDALIAISTSGNSANVVRATEKAKRLGLKVVSLVGAAGGRLAELSDHSIRVPSQRTCRIQEIHITVGHIWCEMIEIARKEGLFPSQSRQMQES